MNRKGFTLIELLVVAAIISVIAAIVLTNLSASRKKAENTARVSEVRQLQNAIELYRADNNGAYPVGSGVTENYASLSTDLVPAYIPSIPFDEQCPAASSNYGYAYCNNTNAGASWVNARCLNDDDASTYAIAFWFNCADTATRVRYCATSRGVYPSPSSACTQY